MNLEGRNAAPCIWVYNHKSNKVSTDKYICICQLRGTYAMLACCGLPVIFFRNFFWDISDPIYTTQLAAKAVVQPV